MKNSAVLSRRLKCLMADKEIKTAELARQVNLPQPTVHRIVSGISPNPHLSSLQPIAKFFGITIDQLKGKKPISWLNINGLLKHQLQGVNNGVPLLERGNILAFVDLGRVSSEQESVATDMKLSKKAFAVLMFDDSMMPVFPRDTVLIFDEKKNPQHKDFVLVHLHRDGSIIFRQLLVDGNHRYLKPLNNEDDQYQLHLLGEDDRVIASLRQIKRDF